MTSVAGWPIKPLEDQIDIFNRQRVPLSRIDRAARQGPYRYFGAQGVIDHIDDFIFDGEFILVAEDGENLRSQKQPIASLVSGRFWVNNHAHIVRARECIADNRFLLHAINQAPISGAITGAAQPKLTKASLQRLEIPCPSFDVQRRLAALFAAFDGLIAINERRTELLEDLARSIYREWFDRFRCISNGARADALDESALPAGWTWETLGSAAAWFSGGTPDTKEPRFWDGDIPWITSGSLRSLLLRDTERRLTPAGVAAGSRVVDRDALLFVVRGMSLVKEFRVGIAERTVAFGQDCKALVAHPGVAPLLLAFTVLARQNDIQGMVELAGHGTGKLATDRIKAVRFPLPPPHIQAAFVEAIAPMREQLSTLGDENRCLARTRDLLLPRLVTGRLDISDVDLGDLLAAEAA